MITELIQEARSAGVTLLPLPNGRLQATGRPTVPSDLKARLSAHKVEIVKLLQATDALADLYRKYWNTPETESLAAFQSVHREIDILERQVGLEVAWRTLEEAARAWYEEYRACPFCKHPDVLHLETERA